MDRVPASEAEDEGSIPSGHTYQIMPASNPYEIAYTVACQELALKNINDVAFNSSATLTGNILGLELAGEIFSIGDNGRRISTQSGREPKMSEKILLLHYLIAADGSPLSRQEVSLANIPGASFYYPTYKNRTIDIILKTFAHDHLLFLNVLKSNAWNIIEQTNRYIKAKLLPLPNVPLYLIYWLPADENLPHDSNLQILYDANITHYLPLEDIIILIELLTHKLIKSAPQPPYLK